MFRQTKEKDEKGGDTRLLLILPAFRERGTNLTEYRSFVMQLADKKIRIKPLYDMIREYCKEYIIPDSYANPEDINSCGNYGENKSFPVNLDVQITPQDIDYERMRSDRQAEMTGEKMAAYSEAYLETLAVYRKIAEWMPMQDILLFHGSVVAVDGKAYLFTAKSGTGKSTHTRLWREYFGNRAVMINDDKPLVKITQDGVYAYGTPWDGKHRLSTNSHAPLAGICILRRGRENVIWEITGYEAYPMLMQQCYRPRDTKALTATMRILDQLKGVMNFYELHCNISKEAVEAAYNGMKLG